MKTGKAPVIRRYLIKLQTKKKEMGGKATRAKRN